jgi:hypothetical protein
VISPTVDVGDVLLVPDVASCLGDPLLGDLASEATWALFMSQ